MNYELLRSVMHTQSSLASLMEEFNKSSEEVKFLSNRNAMLVSGIEKIADYFGFEVETVGDIKYINLMGITVMEGPNETLRDTE